MQFLIYCLTYPFLWLVSKLPFRLLYMVSDGVFFIIYHLIGYRKKVVLENLTLVFPEKPEQEIKRITKAFYHHLCDMMVESIKSLTISEEDMKKRMVFPNIEILNQLETQNKSIILMCSHYGSWEWIFILQKHVKYKGYAVYKRLKNKYFDKLFKNIRAKYNSHLITTKETFRILVNAKNKGQLTINGFVSDQNPKYEKALHWNYFMGIKVPMHVGAEVLAKRLDMAVVFFKVKRLKRGFYETTFETLTTEPNDYKDFEITDLFFKHAEAQIKEAPEYYLWTHKRWKHRNKKPYKTQDRFN